MKRRKWNGWIAEAQRVDQLFKVLFSRSPDIKKELQWIAKYDSRPFCGMHLLIRDGKRK